VQARSAGLPEWVRAQSARPPQRRCFLRLTASLLQAPLLPAGPAQDILRRRGFGGSRRLGSGLGLGLGRGGLQRLDRCVLGRLRCRLLGLLLCAAPLTARARLLGCGLGRGGFLNCLRSGFRSGRGLFSGSFGLSGTFGLSGSFGLSRSLFGRSLLGWRGSERHRFRRGRALLQSGGGYAVAAINWLGLREHPSRRRQLRGVQGETGTAHCEREHDPRQQE
jgi:hypothetical protein